MRPCYKVVNSGWRKDAIMTKRVEIGTLMVTAWLIVDLGKALACGKAVAVGVINEASLDLGMKGVEDNGKVLSQRGSHLGHGEASCLHISQEK